MNTPGKFKREMFDRYSYIALKQIIAAYVGASFPTPGADFIANRACDIAEAMVEEREKRIAKWRDQQ